MRESSGFKPRFETRRARLAQSWVQRSLQVLKQNSKYSSVLVALGGARDDVLSAVHEPGSKSGCCAESKHSERGL